MSCQFAFALILGILLAERGSRQIYLPAVMLAIAVVFPQFLKRTYRECVLRGALIITAGILGAGCYTRHAGRWEEEKQELLCGQQISVCGTLIRKEQKNERWQLTLALPGYENRVVVSTEDGGYPLDCVLSVRGSVREYNSPRNEGQFNEKQYYKNRKIIGRMSAEEMVCIRAPSGIHAWREGLYLVRMRLSAVYEACLPAQEAGIMSAMAVGEKALMGADVRTLFQRAGISHILAISGMHISMIGMGVYALLRKCKRSYVQGAFVTAAILMLYGTMIGMGVSSGRAIGMFLIYLLAQCLGRGYDTCSALAVLAVSLLVENPFLLHDVSFQFSFLAVFAVVTAGMVLPKKEEAGRVQRLTYPACMALLLQLFTLPLVAYYYYELPLYALFLNLFLLPYLGVALGFGLAGGVTGTVLLPCARILLLPCHIVLSVYVWVCEVVEKLPFSTVICGKPSQGELWLYYGLLCILLLLVEYSKKQKHMRGTDRAYGYLVWGAALLLTILIHVPKGGFEIDYLDVGQGDGSMLCTEEGVVCFVDGGSADVSGVGTYRILPFLKSKGIRKVDYWVLSHLDEDHVSGFYEVLEAGFTIGTVVIAEAMPEDEAKTRLRETLAQYEVPVITVRGGDNMQLNNNVEEFSDVPHSSEMVSGAVLHFLSPDVTTPVYDCNGASLVCLYEDANVRALWTGDIGKSQEEWLLKSGKLQEIDIYKAAHHGSRYSNSEEYLKALSPKLSVISCGEHNRYGHPDAEAVEHIQVAGSRILYTMKSGQIKVEACEDGLVAEEFVTSNI
ncbi:MAG: DNA internalization-related competence protein ComEC/Rec2 [Lachnospiraceae bacterium]